MNESAPKVTGIHEFENGVALYLKPVASDFGFRFDQIDSRLFALSSDSLTIKVYFPECHGYDVDIKISPTFSSEWYSPREVSFYWVGQFLGLEQSSTSRRTSTEQIKELLQVNEGFLRQALPKLISAKSGFWDELSLFVEAQISKEDERDKKWVEEQRLSEVRQKIDMAWKAKDYPKVISLLDEIKDKITIAEKKKLEYARKQAV